MALPSLGAALSLPNGASCQSHGRTTTGITRTLAASSLHRPSHLDVVTVIGGEEVGADEQQYDVGPLKLLADPTGELIADTMRRSCQVSRTPWRFSIARCTSSLSRRTSSLCEYEKKSTAMTRS